MFKTNIKCIILHILIILQLTIRNTESANDITQEYILKVERSESYFPNPNLWEGNYTSRIFNRTHIVINVFVKYKEQIDMGDVLFKLDAYQMLSNVYRLTSVQFQYDFCTVLNFQETAGFLGAIADTAKGFLGDNNLPKHCPIRAGMYYVKNGFIHFDLNNSGIGIPKNFLGKWKFVVNHIQNKNQKLLERTEVFAIAKVVTKWD